MHVWRTVFFLFFVCVDYVKNHNTAFQHITKMAIALYPYSSYSAFIGGGPTVVLTNQIVSADFCAYTLQFNQGSLSTKQTQGRLSFVLTIWDEDQHKTRETVYVTKPQPQQSITVVRDKAILRIECQVSSNFPQDVGIPVTFTLQSLVQGNDAANQRGAKIPRIAQSRDACSCNRCIAKIVASLPCPTASLVLATATVSSSLNFTGIGTNIMYLNPKPCGVPMVELITTATITQGTLVIPTQILLTSSSTFDITFQNGGPVPFVAGAASITITPRNPNCAAIVLPVTLVAPP